MSGQVAWLFPGQGSQAVGMGTELVATSSLARQTFEEADDILRFPLSRLMAEGPKAVLDDTLNTQPALYVHSVAVARVAQAEGLAPAPQWVAGHSLGEYSALTAAGALPFEDGVRLVQERGRLMAEAGRLTPGGMAAILGLETDALSEICVAATITSGQTVQIANDNCPGQVVISGTKEAVAIVSEAAREAGARQVIPLDVSIPAHSALMQEARYGLDVALAEARIGRCAVPLIANTIAHPIQEPDEIREELSMQMTGPVRWTASMRYLIEQGVTRFYELGSSTVLTGLLKRIDKTVERYNLS